jgi:hypothetical protein
LKSRPDLTAAPAPSVEWAKIFFDPVEP